MSLGSVDDVVGSVGTAPVVPAAGPGRWTRRAGLAGPVWSLRLGRALSAAVPADDTGRADAPAADAERVAPIDDPAGLLPLDRTQLDALREHLDAVLSAGDCDRTHRATDAWAAGHGIALDRLHEGLEEYGGFCDCEVVMNVDPAAVFDPQAAAGPSRR